jgi:hypothetical protein
MTRSLVYRSAIFSVANAALTAIASSLRPCIHCSMRSVQARGQAKAKFMGSGPTHVEFAFRPETKGLDFNLTLGTENTDMRTMNDLFRANGNFDVVAGVFSFLLGNHRETG